MAKRKPKRGNSGVPKRVFNFSMKFWMKLMEKYSIEFCNDFEDHVVQCLQECNGDPMCAHFLKSDDYIKNFLENRKPKLKSRGWHIPDLIIEKFLNDCTITSLDVFVWAILNSVTYACGHSNCLVIGLDRLKTFLSLELEVSLDKVEESLTRLQEERLILLAPHYLDSERTQLDRYRVEVYTYVDLVSATFGEEARNKLMQVDRSHYSGLDSGMGWSKRLRRLNTTFKGSFIPSYLFELLKSNSITHSEFVLLCTIDSLSSSYESCYATNNELSEITGLSVRSIKKSLKKLRELGLIRVKTSKGFGSRRRVIRTSWDIEDADESLLSRLFWSTIEKTRESLGVINVFTGKIIHPIEKEKSL